MSSHAQPPPDPPGSPLWAQRPIVIYAATGYTGRLIAAELLQRGERVVLAGRSAAKLQALARPPRRGAASPIAPAALDDPDALAAAAASRLAC